MIVGLVLFLSVSANNNPDCAIGKDAVTIKVEELSNNAKF